MGDLERVEAYLSGEWLSLFYEGKTPLHFACEAGYTRVVKAIVAALKKLQLLHLLDAEDLV